MPRPRKFRRIFGMPNHVYFKPRAVPLSELNEVVLTVDEFEALRLKDLEKIEQTEAAKKMNIHQSTFQRTLTKAREKITDALVNGKAIKIEGGNYMLMRGGIMPRGDRTWPMGQGPISGRGQGQGRGMAKGGRQGQMRQGRGGGFGFGGPVVCKCPNCGAELPHQRGMPCVQIKCPKCGSMMVRG